MSAEPSDRGLAHHHPGGDHVLPPEMPESVSIYDTTLRDGSQQEGLSLTVDDKLRVAEQLDHLGVQFIEGGWPGANPKDAEFFRRAAAGELRLDTATLVAFGSTRKAGGHAETDPVLADMMAAQTPVVCLVAKSAEWHVTETLRTTLTEAVDMVADSVGYLTSMGKRVFLDAEHFFDGYRQNPGFSLDVLQAAADSGAEVLVLCDTNGGSLPFEVERVVGEVRQRFSGGLGCHFHNDSGCAVANSLVAVRMGATQVQGCVNGYGERTGNADLTAADPGPRSEDEGARPSVPTAAAADLGFASHRRDWSTSPRTRTSLSSGLRPSRTRRACTPVPSPDHGDAYEHVDPEIGRQRHPVRGQRDGWTVHHRPESRSARAFDRRRRLRRHRRPAEGPRAPRLPLRGGGRVARAAHAVRDRLEADRSSPSSPTGSSPTCARTGPLSPRRPSRCSSATIG